MGSQASQQQQACRSHIQLGHTHADRCTQKHKKEKHHKKKSKDSKEDLVKQAKEFLKAQLAAGSGKGSGAVQLAAAKDLPEPTLPEDKRITADDYFVKAAEFTAWLQDSKHLYFNGALPAPQQVPILDALPDACLGADNAV